MSELMAHILLCRRLLFSLFMLYVTKLIYYDCGPLQYADLTPEFNESTWILGEVDSRDCNDQPSVSSIKLEEKLTNIEREESGCRNCANRKANLTPQELVELRLEIVKQQILQKLQLTRPPCPRFPKPPLQPLLQAAHMMESESSEEEIEDEEVENDHDTSDFTSRTRSVVIYPTNERFMCVDAEDFPCSRFQFLLSSEMRISAPLLAEIWFYKQNTGIILKLTELTFDERGDNIVAKRDVAIETKISDGRLVRLKIPTSVSWTETEDGKLFDFQLSCYSGCNLLQTPAPVSDDNMERPFLIVNSANDKSSPRSRRSVECVEGSTTCCRETLRVSFAEIGWDDWILAPDSYDANYCKGKCFSDVSNTRFHHSTVLHRFIQSHGTAAEDIGLKMCCTPSKMSPLSILYRDDNGTIIKSSLPNMKVEICDCA